MRYINKLIYCFLTLACSSPFATVIPEESETNGLITTINQDEQAFLDQHNPTKTVKATVETEPVPVRGDAADDIAIWIHPTAPNQSTVIGTQKKGALVVYDLAGQQLQYLADGKMNNVDLRYHFPLGSETVTLVAASNRTTDSIALYKVNPLSRQLENVAARTIITSMPSEPYGLCMYHNPLTHQYYVFVNDKGGNVEQWEVFANQNGQVDAKLVRRFQVGSQTEGCVADDQLGYFYIGEEDVGIWKYHAKPDGGNTRTQVDSASLDGHIIADVEGLTLYKWGDENGYLIASNQGNNTFTVYNRSGNNKYLGRFKIVDNDSLNIDGVNDTDGIDVTNVSLGTTFPYGVFIAQDGFNRNPRANQNFKLVPWEQIADALGLNKNNKDNPQ